jgi:hypothetical protein
MSSSTFAAGYHRSGKILPVSDTRQNDAADMEDDQREHHIGLDLVKFFPELPCAAIVTVFSAPP